MRRMVMKRKKKMTHMVIEIGNTGRVLQGRSRIRNLHLVQGRLLMRRRRGVEILLFLVLPRSWQWKGTLCRKG
jgi:hypothetical protein